MIGFKIRRMPVVAKVNQARVLVEYRVLIEEPKSPNGKRTGQASPCIPSGTPTSSGGCSGGPGCGGSPTLTPVTRTCSGAGRRWPRFTRSLLA